ncbi:hypothetical protein AMST5_00645 [freshwater sediment metagenome]|uniref:Toprim domain-containing protein n=1 Tax=freshwater sediment metagenome TaxID=556182 RepID=A0AA48LZF7_9ZZZZ
MQAAEAAKDETDRIAIAHQWWNEAGPIEGSLGESYLVETRAIKAASWPSSVRWHSKRSAIVCAVTDDAGKIVAVQVIRVARDATGKPIKDDSKGVAKQSYGAVSLGVMRLRALAPEQADGPLCYAEGPETGLTIWAATGYETHIILGGVKRAADIAPLARRVVICRDDDKRTSPAAKAAKSAVRNMRAAGVDVREAFPFDVRRADKSDLNDLAQEQGLDAVRQRIEMAAIDEPNIGQCLVTVEEARERIDKRVVEFFDLVDAWHDGETPPVHALGVTVGTGKTEAALRHALQQVIELRKRGDQRAIVFAVPEHRLSGEIVERLNTIAREQGWLGLRAHAWRGREAKRPGAIDADDKMCRDLETVRHAQLLSVDVDDAVCAVCLYKEGCAYLAQRKRDADVWIVARQIIFHRPPKPVKERGIAALVVDESPWQAGLIGIEGHGVEIALDALEPGVMPAPPSNGPNGGELLVVLRHRLAMALDGEPDGPVKRKALNAAGFDAETGRVAGDLEWRRKIDDGPWRERDDNRTLRPMASLWRAVGALMSSNGPKASGWLTLARNRDGARVIRVTGRKSIWRPMDRLLGNGWHVPTLLVDALLDVELVRPFWPNIENKGQFDVMAPHQLIRQATGKSFAKNYLAPPKSEDGDNKSRGKARRSARAVILRRARELGLADDEVLVIGNKAVVQAVDLPSNVQVAWFNAVAGRDQWKDVGLVVIVGRPMPSPPAIEKMAAALTGTAPLTVDGWYNRGDAFRLKREGDSVIRVPAEADFHPDRVAERIRARICAGELVQAIGRGRGVNRTADHPLEVLVLGDAVQPMPVDEFLPDEFIKPSTGDLMLAEGGVAFEDGASAARAYPSLWRTPEAAKKALQRESCGTFSNENILIGKCPGASMVVFQLGGNGQRPQRAVYDLCRVPDPRATIEAMLGPLAKFEIIKPEATEAETAIEPVTAAGPVRDALDDDPDIEAAIAAFLRRPATTIAEPKTSAALAPPIDQLAELARRWGRPVVNAADGRSAKPEPFGLVIGWPQPVASADVLREARLAQVRV